MRKSLKSLLIVLSLSTIAFTPVWAASLTTLVVFNGANGSNPNELIVDARSNLLGTTSGGGANDLGTVFKIPKTGNGYANAPVILASFNGTNGAVPTGPLIADVVGNLFGVTARGGQFGYGTVFVIAKTTDGYASVPKVLASFNFTNGAYPSGRLLVDADGNLLGTTQGGGAYGAPNNYGTVFEIAKTAGGYANVPTTLFSFNGANGLQPHSGLVANSDGNLFGVTLFGGVHNRGTVFEIAKTATGYASTPTTLVSFNVFNGNGPWGTLIADANSNLFGTTVGGGASPNRNGTVFEIVKTARGYSSSPTTLINFDGANGALVYPGVIADAQGNLFGATQGGGANRSGTVFEIAKTPGGYANVPTTLVSFSAAAGSPFVGVVADAKGNLFGATTAGGDGNGTVFEVTGSGFVTVTPFTARLDILFGRTPAADAFELTSQLTLGSSSNGIKPACLMTFCAV